MKWLQGLLKDASEESPVGEHLTAAQPLNPPATAEPLQEAAGPNREHHAAPVDELAQAAVCLATTEATAPMQVGVAAESLTWGRFEAALAELGARQEELTRLFESRIHSDEVQGRAVERLSDELRDYKTGFIQQQMLPLFKDIIFCHDFVTSELTRLRRAEPDGGDLGKTLEMTGQMLLDLLFKYDIEPYRCEGGQFDPKYQQCTRTTPTETATQDKHIAEVGLTGFRSPTGVVRREQVGVWKYKPPAS